MLAPKAGSKLYIYDEPVDMRKAIDGLSILVVENLNAPLQSGDMYIFRSRNYKKVKILFWDKNGFVLHYKRLEKGKLKFPREKLEGAYEISHEQLNWLLAGLDFILMNDFSELNYENYF